MKQYWNRSFPLRIAVKTGFLLIFVLSVMFVSMYASVAWLINQNINATVISEANALITEWNQNGLSKQLEWEQGYYQVRDREGRIVLSKGKHIDIDDNHEGRPPFFPRKDFEGRYFFKNIYKDEHAHFQKENPSFFPLFNREQSKFREVSLPFTIGSSAYTLELAIDLEDTNEFLHNILLIFLGISAGGVLLITAVVGYSTFNAFRPITTLAERIQSINEKSLSHRIVVPVIDHTLQRLVKGLNEMLERLNRSFIAQSTFVQDASHELRTPLAVLRSEMEIALRKSRSETEYKEILERCLYEIEHMSNVSTQLLTLARFDHRQRLDRTCVELDKVINDSIRKIEARQKEKQIHIRYIPTTIQVWGDSLALEIVIVNLLQNAIHAMDAGGTVEITCQSENNWAQIAITDNGKGIPADAIPHLFDRFYRVDEARNRQEGGTGLGLAICKSIVTVHQGKIEVVSTPGSGSTFTICIPLFK
ncbi:sensor histidine kinase [Brevibacillus sp. SYSU BS000544]|uniref:sensor histidine kinase n=1 Tax=Brevibacillus sp. SYSU BS000544 TaxID=3416443 RepID=UPI003CE44DBF